MENDYYVKLFIFFIMDNKCDKVERKDEFFDEIFFGIGKKGSYPISGLLDNPDFRQNQCPVHLQLNRLIC